MGQPDDEYSCVSKNRLSLKIDTGAGSSIHKKKHKKHKNKDKTGAGTGGGGAGGGGSTQGPQGTPVPQGNPPKPYKTPAEQAFQKMHEKMQKERISQKAAMTHKERVEKFNQHLDSLTEHFDIPKVSWTK